MLHNAQFVAALLAALFGGGGIFALAMRWLETRRAEPLNELASLADLQKQIREEVRRENAVLRQELHDLRDALSTLTKILDELLPKIEGLDEDQKKLLHEAKHAAHRTLF